MITGYVLCNPINASNSVIAIINFTDDTKSNINRDYMHDINHALHRCNKAYIIKIFDPKNPDIEYLEANTISNLSERYRLRIGTIFESDIWTPYSSNSMYGDGLYFTLTEEAIYGYIPKHERNGLYKYWHCKNGRLTIHTYYDNGKITGPYYKYDTCTGMQIENTYYSNDVKHGISQRWKDGNLIEECNYVDDVYHDRYRYYINKILRKDVYYKHGKLDGLYVLRNSDGSVSLSAHYKNNLLHGIQCIHDEKGRLIRTEMYQKGKLRSMRKIFNDDDIQREILYLDGVLHEICL